MRIRGCSLWLFVVVSSSSSISRQVVGQLYTETCGTDEAAVVRPGSLRPEHLPGPVLFDGYTTEQEFELELPEGTKEVKVLKEGQVVQIVQSSSTSTAAGASSSSSIQQARRVTASASVGTISQAIPRASVQQIRKFLEDHEDLDVDPDTVDGMPTYEIFMDSPELVAAAAAGTSAANHGDGPLLSKVLDYDPDSLQERTRLRHTFHNLTSDYVDHILTPLIRQYYPDVCARTSSPDRLCTPCYSLIRRYREGERQSHATHHDAHALVTVVVSLSDYDTEYRGGLYVSTQHGQRHFLRLDQGDAALHRSNLLHGVQVYENDQDDNSTTVRWSWILWYLDSVDCHDYSQEWFAECSSSSSTTTASSAVDPVCQYLHSTKLPDDMYEEILELTRSSALGGVSEAAMKMARGHLKRLPSPLAYNVTAAKRYYDIGMDVHSPDAYYGMAELLLTQMANASTRRKSKRNANSPSQQELQEEEGQQHQEQQQTLQQVLRYLEEAAMLGHAFAMYNLGMAHSFGYGVNSVDHDVAREWFIQSGLPEGAYLAAHQAKSRGNTALEQALFQKAAKLGFGTPWRKEVRMETGSGGSGGVDLNLPWPMSRMGRVPPQL